jgi:hypothetical protein
VKKFCFITTVKGRLSHLRHCGEALMTDRRVGKEWSWVVVDFACPEKSGDWVKERFGDRATVLYVPSPDDPDLPEDYDPALVPFVKTIALNSGAVEARDMGAEYLVFLDADTVVSPAFLEELDRLASLDSFLIVEPRADKRDLTGFLCVHHRHFFRVGGFDTNFQGWGAEDLELRVKLHLLGKLPFHELPALAASVTHDDSLRTRFYEQKDKDESHTRNLNRLCANVFKWTGKHLLQHYETQDGHAIRRLLGVEPISAQGLLK